MLVFIKSCADAARRALTTSDNQTPDIIRIGTVLTGGTMIFACVWAVVVNKTAPGMLDLGGGVGALFTGAGAAIGLKRKEEAGV